MNNSPSDRPEAPWTPPLPPSGSEAPPSPPAPTGDPQGPGQSHYPPQGAPAYPPQSYPAPNYPPQNYPQPGYPGQGYPAPQYPAQNYPAQSPYSAPVSPSGSLISPGSSPDKRPGTVTTAAWLTIVPSAFVALTMLMLGIFAILGQDALLEELREDRSTMNDLADMGIELETIPAILAVVAFSLAVWAVVAVVLAVLVLHRSQGARIALIVSSGFAALAWLLSITLIVTIIPLAASIAVMVLLLNGKSNAWFKRKQAQGSGPVYPGQAPW